MLPQRVPATLVLRLLAISPDCAPLPKTEQTTVRQLGLRQNWNSPLRLWLNGVRFNLPSGFVKDLEVGLDCLNYTTLCTWWEWAGGSRLLYWRWTKSFQQMERDGIKIYWLSNKRPSSKKLQAPVKDQHVLEKMKDKINNVRSKGYIQAGFVES